MTPADWIQLIATLFTIIVAVGGSAIGLGRYLVKSSTDHAVDAIKVAQALDRLNETARKLTTAIEHMDTRLNQHDLDIALIKQVQKQDFEREKT